MTKNPADPTQPALGDEASLRPITREEKAYRDGYVSGSVKEERNQQYARERDRQVAKENAEAAASNGWLFGILMATVIGLIAVVFYVLATDNGPQVLPVPTATDSPTEPSVNESKTPKVERETTIIERTVEKVQDVTPTTIQVNVESPQQSTTPAAETAPSTEPAEAKPAEPETTEPETTELETEPAAAEAPEAAKQ